jgi:hypothetical protein
LSKSFGNKEFFGSFLRKKRKVKDIKVMNNLVLAEEQLTKMSIELQARTSNRFLFLFCEKKEKKDSYFAFHATKDTPLLRISCFEGDTGSCKKH